MNGLIVDSFAGGGGASTGIERALGRPVDIAINHDENAIAMHMANHPHTRHLSRNIWKVDPLEAVRGQKVSLAWFSPDCKHFSKAKGGRPVKRSIRDLAWVVVLWAKRARPDVILLENVEEFRDWGPLIENGAGAYVPCPDRKGETFNRWVGELRRLGYAVAWRELRACDYGAPTIRKRLFLVARCDGKPITWPEPTHGDPESEGVKAGLLKPWRTAADIIDWSLPCPSIFDTADEIKAKHGLRAKRPLADATLRRIARGVVRYVLENPKPFIVRTDMAEGAARNGVNEIDEPLRTITTGGSHAVVAPSLVQTGYGERAGQAPRALDIGQPIGTQVAGAAKHALVAAFLAQHNGGVTGHKADKPLSTMTQRGTQQQVVALNLMHQYSSSPHGGEGDLRKPIKTQTAGGNHACLVASFLTKYYGTWQTPELTEPMPTDTTKDRFGLVTVNVDGQTFVISDIGMRMLTPRERFRAQGFPEGYDIDTGADGRTFTKSVQGSCCGNSVCPDVAEALVRANCCATEIAREAVA